MDGRGPDNFRKYATGNQIPRQVSQKFGVIPWALGSDAFSRPYNSPFFDLMCLPDGWPNINEFSFDIFLSGRIRDSEVPHSMPHLRGTISPIFGLPCWGELTHVVELPSCTILDALGLLLIAFRCNLGHSDEDSCARLCLDWLENWGREVQRPKIERLMIEVLAQRVPSLSKHLSGDKLFGEREAPQEKAEGMSAASLRGEETPAIAQRPHAASIRKNARTTPAVRAEIAASNETASVLAQRYGITEQTVYKWKKRDVFGDRSHTAHRLQTVLTPAQEAVVVHLRRTLLLPLDDLLAVTREFLSPDVSRSGLDRCLRRHGAGNLNDLKPRGPVVTHKAFKSYEPGYVHVDVKYLPQMREESSRRYLFVAIDRATRWVFVQLKANMTGASAQAFVKALHKACPIKISKLLTESGKEFTVRLFASKEREPRGNQQFDQLCQELGIEPRLTKPKKPSANGMVERFNGHIADVLKTHRFNRREDMQQNLQRYVALYNHQLPQSALDSKTPMQVMKQWYQERPDLFYKRPYDRPGYDT